MRLDLNPLVSVIGIAALEKLAQSFGGLTIRVPANRCEMYSDIESLIGVESMVALAQYAGGSTIYIPKGSENSRAIRNATILEAYRNKIPVQDIARRFGLSDRAVWYIVKNNGSPSETFQP